MQASSRNRIKRLIRNNSKPLLKRVKLVGVVLGNGVARILTRNKGTVGRLVHVLRLTYHARPMSQMPMVCWSKA